MVREPYWSRRKTLWALAVAPFVAAGGVLAWLGSSRGKPLVTEGAVGRRETRPTLEPAHYTGKTRRAHEVAREIPDVLDQLRCYCQCEGIGHVSLLSCYTDGHAATCIICMDEALDASRMVAAGWAVPDIRASIDRTYRH